MNLETIVLFVSDMAVSQSFYEHTLGLRALEVTPRRAIFAAGHVRLCLLPAADHGVTLQPGLDRSADITFMVPNLARCRDLLAARGVRFSRTLEYSIGQTTDFYDPDGHWFSLYQPSDAARTWPSGPKLEALASALPQPRLPADDLADAFIPYVFLFFGDPDSPTAFYEGRLGFEIVEGGPCRRVPTNVESGVIKYDAGTTMLTTHHVDSEDKRFRVSTVGTDGVAMTFGVADVTAAVDDLSRRGIAFSGPPADHALGRVARFLDPAGHVLLLREPAQHEDEPYHGLEGSAASAVGSRRR